MAKIQSVYIPDDKLIAEADKIRWRDHKSFSQIINLALEEYVKSHKDGNEQFTLDDPIVATPSFFRENAIWKKYFENLKDSEENPHKFKLQELNFLFKKRFGHSL